jgi:hypothetical protein
MITAILEFVSGGYFETFEGESNIF